MSSAWYGESGRRSLALRGLVAFGLAVTPGALLAQPAAATTPPSVAAPDRVYPTENSTLTFSGTDPVSGDNRSISISDTVVGAGGCPDSAANGYSVAGCAEVELTLNDTDPGLLLIPNVQTHSSVLVTPDGAIVSESSDPSGGKGALYFLRGTQTQLNSTLATLQFVPTANYRETDLSQDTLPALHIVVVNGDEVEQTSVDVQVKVEGANQAPAIVVHDSPLSATTSQQADYVLDADVTDPELCTKAICGSPYTNNTPIADPDSSMLLVAWLDPNCGKFNFGGAEFSANGSVSNNDVDSLLLNTLIDENADNGYNTDQRAAIEDSLDPTANSLDLTEETGTASQDTTVFAGISDLSDVDYAVSHIEYTAPSTPKTCHLNLTVSDLGNLGTPTSFDETANPVYEVPDAQGASGQVVFKVVGTHPNVTVEQTPSGSTPGVDPTHTAANYAITFDQPVDSFDETDVSFAGSDTGITPVCNLIPVTPNVVWNASCTSTKDGVIQLSVPAGLVYAQGHTGDATYANLASTSTDNSITWDATAPTATIDPDTADGQASPTGSSPIKYTVNFSEPTDGAGTFTGSDIDLSQSTAGGTLTASVSGPNLPLHPDQYTVTVTGMTTPGNVVAKIPAGVVEDRALNPNAASTSTDNDNVIQWQPVIVKNPTITAHVASAHKESKHGWYRSAVTVHFICTAGSAPLVGDCPANVVLRHQTKKTTVTRTVTATDGGHGSATVQIKIDETRPVITILGVKPGHRYPAPGPTPRCKAKDTLSGIASCKVHTTRTKHSVKYRVVATDNAGNQSTKTGHYLLRPKERN